LIGCNSENLKPFHRIPPQTPEILCLWLKNTTKSLEKIQKFKKFF